MVHQWSQKNIQRNSGLYTGSDFMKYKEDCLCRIMFSPKGNSYNTGNLQWAKRTRTARMLGELNSSSHSCYLFYVARAPLSLVFSLVPHPHMIHELVKRYWTHLPQHLLSSLRWEKEHASYRENVFHSALPF